MKRTISSPNIGDRVSFVQTSAETNGEFSRLEVVLQPGGGNPLHYHRSYHEVFTAVEGALGVAFKNKAPLTLKPGESYTITAGEVHRFFNPGETAIKFIDELHPGNAGFENHLRILYGLAAEGLCNEKMMPKKFSHLAICAVMSDTLAPGLLSLTMPLLRLVAWWAKKRGIEKALLNKYCV